MTPKFWITNFTDRPCERLIAEQRGENLYYINPELRDKWADRPMSMDCATPLEDFGIKTEVVHGYFVGILFPKRAHATYADGKPRRWQGSQIFRFPYDPDFTFGAASQREG